jgi:hypothetical protein
MGFSFLCGAAQPAGNPDVPDEMSWSGNRRCEPIPVRPEHLGMAKVGVEQP